MRLFSGLAIRIINGVRILVVEDERRMADLLRKGLEEELHSVSVVFDGHSAIEFARTSQFDAIVLDVMIPGLDGFEVARRLRQSDDHTPVLMLTARARGFQPSRCSDRRRSHRGEVATTG